MGNTPPTRLSSCFSSCKWRSSLDVLPSHCDMTGYIKPVSVFIILLSILLSIPKLSYLLIGTFTQPRTKLEDGNQFLKKRKSVGIMTYSFKCSKAGHFSCGFHQILFWKNFQVLLFISRKDHIVNFHYFQTHKIKHSETSNGEGNRVHTKACFYMSNLLL